jgi:hypothetical protein
MLTVLSWEKARPPGGVMAGVGKTAFAVHVAHQLAPQFPAGQIFLPLHGHTPGQAVTRSTWAGRRGRRRAILVRSHLDWHCPGR